MPATASVGNTYFVNMDRTTSTPKERRTEARPTDPCLRRAPVGRASVPAALPLQSAATTCSSIRVIRPSSMWAIRSPNGKMRLS